MTMLSLMFFYTIAASIIFTYGIGLERVCINIRLRLSWTQIIGQNLALMFCAATCSWILQLYIARFIRVFFLMPILIGLVVYTCEYMLQRFVFKNKYKKREERLFTCGTIYFALYYALSYVELLVIIISACINMIIWTYFLHSISLRIDDSAVQRQWRNTPLLLISMGIITLALYAWDSSWMM